MALDKITEIVAHFIGVFETAEDGARLREITEAFDHSATPQSQSDPLATIEYLLRAPYEHLGTQDGLSFFRFTADAAPFVPALPSSAISQTWLAPITSFSPTALPDLQAVFPGNQQALVLTGAPPGSSVVITAQVNILIDNDLLIGAGTMDFIDPASFDMQLAGLVSTADAMTYNLAGNPLMIATTGSDFGQTLGNHYDNLAQNAPDGAQVTVLSGAAAVGITVNGSAADAMPELDAVFPVHFQPSPPDADVPDVVPAGAGGNAAAAAAVFEVEDGQNVVAGGNFAINEAIIAYSAADAPVLAVMGDAICTLSISQINVMQNADSNAVLPPSDTSLNAATIAGTSSQTPDDITTPPSQDLPQGWSVTRVDGDLMTVNWLHQYNFVSDHDRAEVTFTGQDSYLALGENTALNQTTLLAWGAGYDLIIVGGQMIDMALINQTNVLLDDDALSYGGEWPATLTGGENLALNAAVIESVGIDTFACLDGSFAQAGQDLADGATTISGDVAQSDYFAGIPFLNVLYIAGDLITVTAIAQTNILGDADQLGVALDGVVDDAEGPVTVTAGANAVVNIASIMEYGLDSIVMVGGEVYDDVLLYQAELIENGVDPLGAAQTPLANEAVAFLADEMVEDAPVTQSVFADQSDTSTTSVDVMGGIVA